MTSIVRIKRRSSQEPAEALLLAAKRMKVEVDELKTPSTEESVFRFCGTVDSEAENLQAIAQLVEKGKSLSHRKQLPVKRVFPKKQANQGIPSSEKKYKLLSSLRNLEIEEGALKVYDLVLEAEAGPIAEETVTCNNIPLVVETCHVEPKYVYDFYYSDGGVLDDSYIDKLMSVQPYYYQSGQDEEDSDKNEEDEDSNDENNWRNDYPDEDEGDASSDEDIVGKMTGMHLEGDGDLSTDDEDLVYPPDDEDRHGVAYAKYKKRIAKDLLGSDSETDDEEDSDNLECYD